MRSARHAIELALEKGVSSKSQIHNRGEGLDLLDALVERNRGALIVASGGAAYIRTSQGRASIRNNPDGIRVPGTLCLFEFRLDNELYPDHESDEDIW